MLKEGHKERNRGKKGKMEKLKTKKEMPPQKIIWFAPHGVNS
jgi:hypothetical protein